MKKNRGFTVTMLPALAAVLLLSAGGITGARAALQYLSKIYEVPLAMQEIGIGILENSEPRDFGTLLPDLVDEESGEKVRPGVRYDENVDVVNNGEIDEYIRAAVYRYWLDGETGEKDPSLDPSLIILEDPEKHGWIHDEAQSTPEREVYYYMKPTRKGTVLDLFDTLMIDPKITDLVSRTGENDLVTDNVYHRKAFGIKVEVSGVQTHNAADAIRSAWGADGSIPDDSTLTGSKRMRCTFDGKKLHSDSGSLNALVNQMQPGDSVRFQIELENLYKEETAFWMRNKVLKSFEDNSPANGGAYAYVLTYTDPAGNTEDIFRSDTVGGEEISGGREGLREAADSLEDYFYLCTLKRGQLGTVTLTVSLDGETQGNDYQNTLADIDFRFACEAVGNDAANPPDHERPRRNIVKTGDPAALLPYAAGFTVSGLLLMIIALYLKRRKGGDADA